MDTVYSLSRDAPRLDGTIEPADGLTFQPGALIVGSIRQVCLIRKLGAGGAVLHVDTPLDEGVRLELELDTGEQLEGSVAWSRAFEIGLRFDRPIDVLPILARNLVSQPGERRRMPRVEILCQALLEADGKTELVTTRDIAQGGMKLDTTFQLDVDQRVTVTPEGLRPIEAVVRWAKDSMAGIAFHPEVSWQELMPWLRERRGAPPPDFMAPPRPSRDDSAADAAPRPQDGSVQLNLQARVREGTRRWAIEVETLTARTVEFESYAPIRLGTLLWIVLPGLEGWPARVVGIDGYRFTCEFTQPLHPAVLERILISAGQQA